MNENSQEGKPLARRDLVSKVLTCLALVIVLLAFWLRTRALGAQELTFDEVASFTIAARGPIELLDYLRSAIREHPPFYYFLLSLWMPFAGTSEFALRFMSVIIGTTTVAVMYRLLRRSGRLSVALLATLLLAVSPFHIQISRDARMYGLLALWSLLSVFTFAALLSRGEDQPRPCPPDASKPGQRTILQALEAGDKGMATWALFWVVTGLGLFTHYFMAFVLLAEDLFLLLNWRRHRNLLFRWLAVHALVGAAVIAWTILSPGLWATLVSLWERGMASTVRWESLASALNGLYLGITLPPNWYHLSLPLIVTALGLAPLGLKSPLLSRRPRRWRLLLSLLLIGPVIAVLALPERIAGRYLTTALPGSILAMAAGLVGLFLYLRRRLAGKAGQGLRAVVSYLLPSTLLLGILFTAVGAYPPIYASTSDSFAAKMAYVREHAQPDDGLLLHGPWQELLLSYYDPELRNTYTIPLQDLEVDAELAHEQLSKIFEAHQRLWVSYGSVGPVDPNRIVARWLHEHAHQVSSHRGLVLYRQSPSQELPSFSEASNTSGYQQVESVDVTFGERLTLEGVALSNQDLASREAVLVLTQWRGLQAVPSDLIMQLELTDLEGRVWQAYQFDVGPALTHTSGWDAGETFVERRGLVVPVGTPPGDYTLHLRVLSSPGNEWAPDDGDSFEIGAVHVQHSRPPGEAIHHLPGRDLEVRFGDELALVGYAPWGQTFTQGNPLLFEVYWQALSDVNQDLELAIGVLDKQGTVLAEKQVQQMGGWCPTSRWLTGDVVRSQYAVSLPADASPGTYQVRLAIYSSEGTPLTVSGTRTRHILGSWEQESSISGTELVLFDAEIEARPRRYRPPATSQPVGILLGGSAGQEKVELMGYNLSSDSVRPGKSVELTLYWKALQRMERVYAVFNHLVAPDGTRLSQKDGWPREGTYHTNQWLPGEIVEDQYVIPVPADAPPGEYALRVGMYDAATEERLIPLAGGAPTAERHIELTTITVNR